MVERTCIEYYPTLQIPDGGPGPLGVLAKVVAILHTQHLSGRFTLKTTVISRSRSVRLPTFLHFPFSLLHVLMLQHHQAFRLKLSRNQLLSWQQA